MLCVPPLLKALLGGVRAPGVHPWLQANGGTRTRRSHGEVSAAAMLVLRTIQQAHRYLDVPAVVPRAAQSDRSDVPQRADPPPRPLWSRGCCRSCYQALAAARYCLTLARWRSTSVCRSASLQDGQHVAGVGSQGHVSTAWAAANSSCSPTGRTSLPHAL